MAGWSAARKKAFHNIKKCPNAYHYRFNKPGETQRTGEWTKDEHKHFMQLLLTKGANRKWGLFSMNLPGRVGYSCANYYRSLVKQRKIWDPNYSYDGKSLRFKRGQNETERKFSFTVLEDSSDVFGRPPAQHPKHPPGLDSPQEVAVIASRGFITVPSVIKRDRSQTASNSESKRKLQKSQKRSSPSKAATPDASVWFLPRFIDPFTKREIKRPAISPYGHVCEYDIWIKALGMSSAKEICPFTGKPLTREQLVRLTPDNIREFNGKIVNQDFALRKWRESTE